MRKIVKAKLTNTDKVDVSFQDHLENSEDGEFNEVDMKCTAIAHPDLIEAFKQLDIHLAALCEQNEFTDMEDNPEKLYIFHTTQISIGGEGEHEGATLTGMRTLRENKVLNLNAPFTKFQAEHSHYPYAESMNMAVSHLLEEVDAYLNGKHAPTRQLSLFDGEEDGDGGEGELEEVEKAPKARKSRKLGKDHPIVKGLGPDVEVTVEV